MIRGTTPTFRFKAKDKNGVYVDFSQPQSVKVTLKQSGKRIDIDKDRLEIDGFVISLWLTQQESLKLTSRIPVGVQINWTYPDPNGGSPRRGSTLTKYFMIDEQFHERVIE